MNNTDILEELKEFFDKMDYEAIKHKPEDYIQAISTLIAENKELKEENEGLKTKLDTLIEKYKDLKEMLKHRIEYTNKLEKDLFQNASNYVIPKSKIKAKIEEVKDGTFDAKIVLQSLLGEE